MASLQNTRIQDTFPGLIKTEDNAAIGATEKALTDGVGNPLPLEVSDTTIKFTDTADFTGATVLGDFQGATGATGATGADGSTGVAASYITTGTQNIGPGSSLSATATCGSSTYKIVGGGCQSTGIATDIIYSYPSDAATDGWICAAENTGGSTITLTAYAVCINFQ